MVVGIKLSIPSLFKPFQESNLTECGWPIFSDNINNLIEFRLCIRGIVTNNHSANVNALSALIKISL